VFQQVKESRVREVVYFKKEMKSLMME